MNGKLLASRTFAPRALVAVAAMMAAPNLASAAAPAEQDAGSTINYAFATELGSGLYDLGGRTIVVFRVAPDWSLREPDDNGPGVRLVLPLTAGFFDLTPKGVIGGQIPSRIDSFSIMPGIEVDFPLRKEWTLTPYLRAGASIAQGNADGWLYGSGVRLERNIQRGNLQVLQSHEFTVARVDYHGSQTDDDFVRLRQAVEVRRPAMRIGADRRLLPGIYAILDVIPDPPAVPLEAGRQGVVQLEAGITIDTAPALRIGRLRVPKLGFGYRQARDFSGWRVVLFAPF